MRSTTVYVGRASELLENLAVGIFAHCFMDYNLVMATPFGLPIGTSSIRKALNDLIREHDLPPVVFHSLRHTSVTYKLKLNGGDSKAVQGDSGHSQINWSPMYTLISLMMIVEKMRNSLSRPFTRRRIWIRVCMPMWSERQ